jgi:hypothetical protein
MKRFLSAMDPLHLNVARLHLHVGLRDMGGRTQARVAEAFSGFICRNGAGSHEILEVLKIGAMGKKKLAPGLDAFIRESLKVPLKKFPFPDHAELLIENSMRSLRCFTGDSRFRLFLGETEKPEETVIYPLDRGCLLRRQRTPRSVLFVKAGYFRGPSVESICNAVHITASMGLPLVDGVMLHGLGIEKQGIGYLFLGLSESGKSTIARFSPPEEVISDDGIIVQKIHPDFYLVPAPIDQASSYRGDLKRGPEAWARLSAGFLLEKDSRVYLERLLPSDACSIIMKNHIHFFRHFAAESVRKTFSLISDLCRQVPFYRLHFKRDPSFWSSILSEMSDTAAG